MNNEQKVEFLVSKGNKKKKHAQSSKDKWHFYLILSGFKLHQSRFNFITSDKRLTFKKITKRNKTNK